MRLAYEFSIIVLFSKKRFWSFLQSVIRLNSNLEISTFNLVKLSSWFFIPLIIDLFFTYILWYLNLLFLFTSILLFIPSYNYLFFINLIRDSWRATSNCWNLLICCLNYFSLSNFTYAFYIRFYFVWFSRWISMAVTFLQLYKRLICTLMAAMKLLLINPENNDKVVSSALKTDTTLCFHLIWKC